MVRIKTKKEASTVMGVRVALEADLLLSWTIFVLNWLLLKNR